MADPEAHIRELAKRVEREPGSRFFVPLADEYRKAGRLKDAIATLEGGLEIHGGYVAARIALARAYLEAGRIEDSISAFSRALADDPSNLVAAKALGDLHLSRGEPLEALKRYRRYRGISGDRKLDALIRRLEEETAVRPTPEAAAPPPLPPPFDAAPGTSPVSDLAALSSVQELLARRDRPPAPAPPDPHDMSPIFYKRPSGPVPIPSEVAEPPSRDVSLDSLASTRRRDSDGEIITRKIRLPEATWPFETSSSVEPAPSAPPVEPAEAEPAPPSPPEPSGRTLADLYFQQGHYPEALTIYRELFAANPSDEELGRVRADAERLATSTLPRELPPADPARERRLEKVRVLNEWLAVVRASAVAGRHGRFH